MYRIIATSQLVKGGSVYGIAIVEKDGKLYESVDSVGRRIGENNLTSISEIRAAKRIVDDHFLLHIPSTEIERLEHWPDATKRFEKEYLARLAQDLSVQVAS
jgi:hypothetical protein